MKAMAKTPWPPGASSRSRFHADGSGLSSCDAGGGLTRLVTEPEWRLAPASPGAP